MKERSFEDRLDEKMEDRGWGKYASEKIEVRDPIPKLPISEKDYQELSLLLGKLALQDQEGTLGRGLCGVFFEVQRRATYGNRYQKTEEMEKVERKMWTLGTGEVIEEPKTEASTPKKR